MLFCMSQTKRSKASSCYSVHLSLVVCSILINFAFLLAIFMIEIVETHSWNFRLSPVEYAVLSECTISDFDNKQRSQVLTENH